MKAEHRKELETNLLADRMGNLIQRMKGGPQRRTIIYIFLILLAIGIGFFVYYYIQGDRTTVAMTWIYFDFGEIGAVIESQELTTAKKAALMQYYHGRLWNDGISQLGFKQFEALKTLNDAESFYTSVSRDVFKDDKEKEWAAEAELALCTIEETRAAIDIKKLDSAKLMYEKVASDYKNTRYGELAAKRKAELTGDKYKEIKEFYLEMGRQYNLKFYDTQLRQDRDKDKKIPLQK